MEKYFADILDYCKDNIERFETRLNKAFCKHIEKGIPFYLANESFSLAVQDSLDEWGEFEDVETDSIDVEEFLYWALDNLDN